MASCTYAVLQHEPTRFENGRELGVSNWTDGRTVMHPAERFSVAFDMAAQVTDCFWVQSRRIAFNSHRCGSESGLHHCTIETALLTRTRIDEPNRTGCIGNQGQL